MKIAKAAETVERQDTIKTSGQKKNTKDIIVKKQNSVDERDEDTVTISGDAKTLFEKSQEENKTMFQEMMEQQKESDAAMKDSIKVRSKCMTIAARLAAGDKVPLKDERYLQKNDPDMYAQAMKVRIPKKDPKEYDSILEDEDEENNGSNEEGTLNVFEGTTQGGMLPGDIQTGN